MIRLVLLWTLAFALPLPAQRVRLTATVAGTKIPLSVARVPREAARSARIPERLLHWQAAQPGLSWSEIELNAGTLRHPVRAIVLRIEPRRFNWQLALVTKANGMTGAWNVDSVADDVVLAFNAGQFKETGPWGWLVLNSYERRDPGYGPVSAGVAFDTSGAVRWVLPRDLPKARTDAAIVFAFQSYPLLWFNGKVPELLLSSDDVDRNHRDARLILGERTDGSLLLVLTRYEALGDMAERVPIGLTLPESLVLMAALGARHAVMLDGGISAQLRFRSAKETYTWPGMRDVPLALLARPRIR